MRFVNDWTDGDVRSKADAAQRDALTEAAVDGELMLKSPPPVGWPRRTGFLAASAGFNGAKKTDTGWQSEITTDASYWIYVNRRTKTFERAGEAISKTLPDRVKRRMG